MSRTTIQSPDSGVEASVRLGDHRNEVKRLLWSVRVNGREVISPSRLGLLFDGEPGWGTNLECEGGEARTSGTESWIPVCGEHSLVEQAYEEVSVVFRETIPPGRAVRVRVRVFNSGAALRYERAETTGDVWYVAGEQTSFCFPEDSVGYREAWPEDVYRPLPICELPSPTVCPLLVQLPTGLAVVHEANNRHSGRMLVGSANHKGVLTAEPQGISPFRPGEALPWRVVMFADTPSDLVGMGGQIASLCPPSEIEDTNWIRPGKCIREVTLSTAGGRACVDFARDHGIAYVHYDAGWYGHEYDEHADPRCVDPDPDRTSKVPDWPGLDLREVIDYGKSQGIGVFVYVNHLHLERYLDEILPLYREWGIAGIKFGFVNAGPAGWTTWLTDAVRKCADHHLMVDIHDAYRPTGLSRTLPNLLTQEGVRGNEHFPEPAHNCLLPYARFVAGAADYTICYRNPRLQTTSAHQLAIAAAFFSPLQFVYWYAQPGDYDAARLPELTWFDRVPTVWDESVGLGGVLGQWAAVARRSGDTWYVGVLNNETARDVSVSVERLGGSEWMVERFEDGEGLSVHVREDRIDNCLACTLRSGGGAAFILKPAT